MDSEFKQGASSPGTEQSDTAQVEVNVDAAGSLSKLNAGGSSEQWRQIGEKASTLLADLPDYLSNFFNEYKRPIVTIGLIFGALVAAKLALAVLGAINDVPLLEPIFEVIGISYSGWFVYRYLLRASNRKELFEDFNSLKEQVTGKAKG